jgi:hypothetical protein
VLEVIDDVVSLVPPPLDVEVELDPPALDAVDPAAPLVEGAPPAAAVVVTLWSGLWS